MSGKDGRHFSARPPKLEVAPELQLAVAGTPGGATGDVVGAALHWFLLHSQQQKGPLTLLAELRRLSVSLSPRRSVQSTVSTEHSELASESSSDAAVAKPCSGCSASATSTVATAQHLTYGCGKWILLEF